LESLPGIGPVFAARIVKYRQLLGYYVVVEQLKEVYGFKDEFYTKAIKFLFIEKKFSPTLKINELDIKILAKHPYVGYPLAQKIINYKQEHGKYQSIENLSAIIGITPEQIQKLKPYFNFN